MKVTVTLVLTMELLIGSGFAGPIQKPPVDLVKLLSKEEPSIARCLVCTWTVEYVQSCLNDGAQFDVIYEIFYFMCEFLPGMVDACKAQVDKEVPIIIEGLTQEDPANYQDICTQLRHCPYEMLSFYGYRS